MLFLVFAMVTQLGQVEDYVKRAIDTAVQIQAQEVVTRIGELKMELTEAFTAKLKENEQALKTLVGSAAKASGEQMAAKQLDLEGRMEIAQQGMTSALVKLGAVESAILPALEPRLHKMESDRWKPKERHSRGRRMRRPNRQCQQRQMSRRRANQ